MSPDPVVDTSPGRHAWPTSTTPVVFREPPTHYEVVKPEYLAEWEALLTEILGIEAKANDAADFAGLQTTSFCGLKPDGHPNPCDCDITGAAFLES